MPRFPYQETEISPLHVSELMSVLLSNDYICSSRMAHRLAFGPVHLRSKFMVREAQATLD